MVNNNIMGMNRMGGSTTKNSVQWWEVELRKHRASINSKGESRAITLEFIRTKTISLEFTNTLSKLNPEPWTLSTAVDCSDLRWNVCAYLVSCLFHFLVPFSLLFLFPNKLHSLEKLWWIMNILYCYRLWECFSACFPRSLHSSENLLLCGFYKLIGGINQWPPSHQISVMD